MGSQSAAHRCHYEVLGLSPTCSAKEVKAAFVTLSKTHHPDLHPTDATKHDKFVRLMEAYRVLSNPGSRSSYDSLLQAHAKHAQMRNRHDFSTSMDIETDAPRDRWTTWKDESIWEMRDKEQDKYYHGRSYYGIKGVRRVHNYWIAGGTVVVMLLGVAFHYVALKHSTTFSTSQLTAQDLKLGHELHERKQKAAENGNEIQLQLLEEQFKNPRHSRS